MGEDEEDEDKENKDEEDKEEEEEKSEKAIKLEEKIKRVQGYLDFHKYHKKKSEYRVGKADLCIEFFPNKKWCTRSKSFNEGLIAKRSEYIQKFINRIANFENELETLLSERQKELREQHEEENNINRKIVLDEKHMELLESEQQKFNQKRDRIENIIVNLKSKEQMVRSEKFKEKIRQKIEKYEHMYEHKDRLLEMIEIEMEDLFGVGFVKSLEKLENKKPGRRQRSATGEALRQAT